MPVALDNLWQKFKGNGQVRNRSSKDIWVVETNTNHPRGPAVAHKLKPNTRSPLQFDIDGFKRFDGKSIEGERAIELTARGLIDNAVLVQPRNRNPYLRSKPDTQTSNNFA